ncbi:MAG: hypothetical protein H7A43_08760 [Verrucomicrobia bacterium]|nr:hypothetical protein [Verrucomicrobiota bacterium]
MKTIYLFFCVCAGALILATQAFSEQPKDLAELIESYPSAELSALADAACSSLAELPSRGISASQQDVLSLIQLRDRLIAEESLPHQMLGLQMQRGVDLALFTELVRSELDKRGVEWGATFDAATYDTKILEDLLARNELPENALYENFIGGRGEIARYCKERDVTADDFVSGNVVQKLSGDLKTTVRYLSSSSKLTELNPDDMSDMLFVTMLKTTDEARDIRRVCQVYFADGELPQDSRVLRAKLAADRNMATRSRALTGNRDRAIEVASIMSKLIGNDPDQYNLLLAYYFAPFMSASSELPAGASSASHVASRGIWLKPAEAR